MDAAARIAQLEQELAAEKASRQRLERTLEDAMASVREQGEMLARHERGLTGRRARALKVYFARGPTGNIKIGISANPWARAKDLATGAGGGVITILATVDGTKDDEKRLHARFADTRLVGEWFSPSPELVTLIESFGGEQTGYVATTSPTTPPSPSLPPPFSSPSLSAPISPPPISSPIPPSPLKNQGVAGELAEGIAAVLRETDDGWQWTAAREQHLRLVLTLPGASTAEIIRRLRIAVTTRYPRFLNLKSLAEHWDAYARHEAIGGPAPPSDFSRPREASRLPPDMQRPGDF